MNKTFYYTLCVCWAVLLATVTISSCISGKGGDVRTSNGTDTTVAEITRMEAPKSIEETERIRVPAVTEAEETTAETDAETYSATDALEIMSGLPLRAEVQLEIEQMCTARDIDPAVVVAMIYHESRYDESKVGDNGAASGLMQVRFDCHYDRMERLGVTDLLDGVQNVIVGIDYLDEMLHKHGGDYGKALTAYNQGHYKGTISRYAIKILEEAESICNQ